MRLFPQYALVSEVPVRCFPDENLFDRLDSGEWTERTGRFEDPVGAGRKGF